MDLSALPPHDRQALQFVLLAALQHVGSADGRLSAPEADAFRSKLEQVARLDAAQTALVRAVAASLLDDRDRLDDRFAAATAGGLTAPEALAEGKAVLDSPAVDPVQGASFRHVVRMLCTAVAASAPLVGERVTAQESAAIDEVARLLA